MIKYQRMFRFSIVAAIAFSLWTQPARAQNGGGNVASKPLSAEWWQWALGQPAVDVNGANTNPVVDSTGKFALAGQEKGIGPGNKYVFLAGSFGGDVTRDVTISSKKSIFFPAINYEADN